MADARSKLDILYQDVLGEIHEVIDRVDGLKAGIPTAADQAAKKLELQTGTMLAAAEKLRDDISTTRKQADAYINAATQNAAEAAIVDIRQATKHAACESVREAVGTEIQTVMNLIKEAAAKLVEQTNSMRAKINDASAQVTWGWGKSLTAMTFAGMIGAFVMFAILHFTGGMIPARPSTAELRPPAPELPNMTPTRRAGSRH